MHAIRAVLNSALALVLFSANLAFSSPVRLPASSLFQTTQQGKLYTCGFISNKWRAGTLKNGDLFLSFTEAATASKSKARKASGTSKSKLLAKAKRAKANAKVGDAICLEASTGNGNSPTPTPTPSVPSNRNFDYSGNVTDAGRALFQIPSGLAANSSTGRQVHARKCVGCHEERTNLTFPSLRTATAQFPMGFTESDLPDSDLAQITAYLNRFRQ